MPLVDLKWGIDYLVKITNLENNFLLNVCCLIINFVLLICSKYLKQLNVKRISACISLKCVTIDNYSPNQDNFYLQYLLFK